MYFVDKCLSRFSDYRLLYLCHTVESNALQLGVFVTGVTLTLAVETPRFLLCDYCSYAVVFRDILKQWLVCANRASLLSFDWWNTSALY